MKAEDEKEPGGDRWPFQTMRNSGDKGGTRARMRGERMEGNNVGEDESGREIERGRKVEGKIEATFSRKGRGGCNERWGKTRRQRKKEKEREKKRKEKESEE